QMFLDFARPPRSERRQTDLLAILHRALALVEGPARRQKVTLAAELPGEPVPLMIDPEQIHQVVVNLLLNALDAMPRGGTVHLSLTRQAQHQANGVARTAAADVKSEYAGDFVAVEVRDHGSGIA